MIWSRAARHPERRSKNDRSVEGRLAAPRIYGYITSEQVTPVIDRRYTFYQPPEAKRYLETGHARAKLAVNIA